jgi:dimethylargininase
MKQTFAITRRPGSSFTSALSSKSLTPDLGKALIQHGAYQEALLEAGMDEVLTLEPAEEYPDSTFVEDTAVVVGSRVVLTRPGTRTRLGEAALMTPVVSDLFETAAIGDSGTLDGGDVMEVGDHYYIGLSSRTTPEGAKQLGTLLEGWGRTWSTVEVPAGLHLKSDVNWLGGNTLLVTRAFADNEAFADFERLVVPEGEEYAANSLRINDSVLTPAGYSGVRRLLEGLGLNIIELDLSEFAKVDGGLSCLSLRFAEAPAGMR